MAPFRYSKSVVLDGSGNGRVRLAPSAKVWTVRYLAVRCSSNTAEAFASVYENQIGKDYLIDTSYTGSTGDTSDTEIPVQDGYAIWVEWTGGDPGATATVTWSGDEN